MPEQKQSRPRLLVLSLACVMTIQANAMSMQELFDSVNAASNVTHPAVIQGQTMNIYTGGSMFSRMPKRTYHLATFTPPSWGAGCGGIDLFAGGFSFINKEQFVAMLRNIGSNALGYGFKLAIQNLCPTCDNVMQALQATAQFINRQNIDSCEAAKGIINAAIPDTWTRDKQNTAKNFGVDTSLFSDMTDAWMKVMGDEKAANSTIETVAEVKPEVKESMPVGNVTWNALKKIEGLTDEYRMLLMSMVGTTILATDVAVSPIVLARKEITVEELIGGNVVDGEGHPMDEISLPIWRCDDVAECLSVHEGEVSTKSFRAMVREKIYDITDHIASRTAFDDPDGVLKFLNATDLPVYKMIAVATTLGNTAMADNMTIRYQELLAAKYAEVYIQRATSDLRAAISKYSANATPMQTAVLKELQPQLNMLETQARQVLVSAYTQTISTYNIAQEVAYLERALTANLSQTLRSSLTFGKSLR